MAASPSGMPRPVLGDATDAELVGAMLAGERDALAVLYDRYGGVLIAIGERMLRSRREAEDLLHDVFLEVWRHARDYDESRGSVRAWLVLRLRSRALDRIKSPGFARVVSLEASGLAEDQLPSRAEPGAGADSAVVRRAVASLPADHRAVLELAYFEGLSLSEIAERLGVPIGTVKSRLARALGKLRDDLQIEKEGA